MRNKAFDPYAALDSIDSSEAFDPSNSALDTEAIEASCVSSEPPEAVVIDGTAIVTTVISRRQYLDESARDWVIEACRAECDNLIARYEGADVAWCFDPRNNRDYRNTIINCYKHGRVSQFDPQIRRESIRSTIAHLRSIGQRVVFLDRFEADDVMADLVRGWIAGDKRVLLISRDTDLNQLQYMPHAGARLTYKPQRETNATCGTVGSWWAVKGACGDVGDNITGLIGIGPQKAQSLTASLLSRVARLERCGTGISDSEVARRIVERNVRVVRL